MMNLSKSCLLATMPALLFSGLGHTQDYSQYKKTSLYADFKAKHVGDIVTILIVESTSGANQSGNNSSSKSSLKASGSITGNLTSALPILGAATDFESSNNGKAGATQQDLLTGKLTAVVLEITPSGNLILSGKRKMEVNGESLILEVKGMVRQNDITAENIVFSYNLANVEISYKKDGFMNKIGRPGLMARWSTLFMAVGLGAAAYLGVSAASN